MSKTLFHFLVSIEDARKDRIIQIYEDHEHLFHTNPGSTHIHQCWPGGLADHLRDMYELAAFVGNVDRTSARILYNSGKDLA